MPFAAILITLKPDNLVIDTEGAVEVIVLYFM